MTCVLHLRHDGQPQGCALQPPIHRAPHLRRGAARRAEPVGEAGELYLRWVGPSYGFFGLALLLYFASQGAGRLRWPIIENLVRLVVAAGGGWLALRLSGGLAAVFAMQALALVAYGLISATAVARGAWSTPRLKRQSSD